MCYLYRRTGQGYSSSSTPLFSEAPCREEPHNKRFMKRNDSKVNNATTTVLRGTIVNRTKYC